MSFPESIRFLYGWERSPCGPLQRRRPGCRPSPHSQTRLPAEGVSVKRAVTISVNGVSHTAGVEPRTLLVHFLREHLNLTGTHVGCDTSNCGACTVLARRRGRQVVHDARRPGRRRGGDDDRGHRRERRPAPRAARLPRAARPPVRLLHAGHGHGGDQAARAQPQPDRRRDPARPRGQPVPLHRLREHRRPPCGRRRGWRCDGHRNRAVQGHRAGGPPQGGQEAPHRQGPVRRRPEAPGHAAHGGRAQHPRARRHHRDRHLQGQGDAGRRRRS